MESEGGRWRKMTDFDGERKALRLQIAQLLIKASKVGRNRARSERFQQPLENHLDEWELERLFQQMHQETQRSVHEQAELRIKRLIQHNPGLLRKRLESSLKASR
jgi:hypothetical protein